MATRGSRAEKVKRIFEQFDMNKDGGLNREEFSSLVVAVNPAVKFSDEHSTAILDEFFNTNGDAEKGLTYDGLLQIYDDGAGDVDRDFDALGLELNDHPLLLQQEIIPEQVTETTDHIISINNSDEDDHEEETDDSETDNEPKISKNQKWLLIAAEGGHYSLAESFMKGMKVKELEYQDENGWTALHFAAVSGSVKIVQALLKKNPKLLYITNDEEVTALESALHNPSKKTKEIVELLCTAHGDDNPRSFSSLLAESEIAIPGLIDAGFYDIVFSVLQRFPNLASEGNHMVNRKALQKMSERPFAFLSGVRLSFWQQLIYSVIHVDLASKPYATKGDIEDPPNSSENLSARPSYFSRLLTKLLSMTYLNQAPCIKRIYNQKLMHKEAAEFVKAMINFPKCQVYLESSEVLKAATIFGTVELVEECFQAFPPLLGRNVNHDEVLLHIAIKERNEKIFKILRDNNERWVLDRAVACGTVGENKTILHLVAKLAPSRQLNLISGAALQMQKEMQWFKAVENIVPEKDRLKIRKKDGKTAHSIFIERHQPLVEKAEKWMKDTSQSCMLVATLIATVAFAAAFTVPGGNISDSNSNENGIPIFIKNNSFMVFAVADALALFSSITSVLMFLAILTSRFAEEDFLKSLPQKLILGFATLFFSIATMMVAFGAALAIVLGDRFAWVPVPIAIFACVPVTLFAFLQFPLFVEMVSSTYWPSIFRERK